MVSVSTTQLCYCSMKAAIDYGYSYVPKNFIYKTGGGLDLACGP